MRHLIIAFDFAVLIQRQKIVVFILFRMSQFNAVIIDVIETQQIFSHAHRPVHRISINPQYFFQFRYQIHRLAAITVQFIDEGEYWNPSHAADFE
ncbi:hypothetical protein SDC9_101624 [bioreactor metagenome]|uniref:Uncharacterized protein n=1 Tax=bioreactor metagenome TaxID=1076179 RepID=A0A645ANL4_9ZZZZ